MITIPAGHLVLEARRTEDGWLDIEIRNEKSGIALSVQISPSKAQELLELIGEGKQ